ncbi:MBL fold metallo-hydrolase [Candidatus Woesearchaeota archaeon]|nr:MBL fold metallo-hydrolase [Candidatus Woesearchaeota archaeon]
MRTRHTKNPTLKTIKQGYKGNPMRDRKFVNTYQNGKHFTFWDFMKWNWSTRKERIAQWKKEPPLVVKRITEPLPRNEDSITWLGHASFLITLSGKRILIDPNLDSHLFLRRRIAKPCTVATLGSIDYVCLSHGHRDHLDKPTLRRVRGKPKALVPLGAKKLVKQSNPRFTVEEAGWWQQYRTPSMEVYFLPASHHHRRGLFDKDKILWGSFLIKNEKHTIYFSGDTAYEQHFKHIKEQFPGIDVCLMPATLYKPEHVMQATHMTPKDSVRAFYDLGGELFIPMHYGTIKLLERGSQEALQEVKDEFKRRKDTKKLRVLHVGETYAL